MKSLAYPALSALFTLTAAGVATAAPAQLTPPADAQQAAAMTYLVALTDHNGDQVPFAPDCVRYEDGLQTGFSGPQLTQNLTTGPQYALIQGIHDLDMTTTGDVVTAHYQLDSGVNGTYLMTVDITETFLIPDGTIHRIDATIVPGVRKG